jgi:signal transduction histidine kinase
MADRSDHDNLGALDLLPEAVVVCDADDVVQHVNDRARVLLGLNGSAVGTPVGDVVAVLDDAGEPCGSAWVERPAAPATRLAERVVRVCMPDGHVRAVALAGRVLPNGGLVLTFRSAGRRLRVDAARSDLIATVSHEIRSPLTSVKGFTSTLLRRWDRFSDEQKQAMLETIDHDADRVTRLLKELLAVSRIDAGRLQMHREVVDVVELVDGLVERARHRDEGVGRDLIMVVDGDPPPAFVDADKLEQVVSNLLENALRYAPDSQVRVVVAARDGSLHLAVEDDGPGIPADQMRRIFEKFGRGRGNRHAGTGLGLYITRGLIRAHGGQVWCESAEGAGAAFHVVLPLRA